MVNIAAVLPRECLSLIISKTDSPKDACRSAAVCRAFRAAADSNDVWKKFLPPDHADIISTSPSHPILASLSHKQLFFYLTRNPILLNLGTNPDRVMSFSLENKSGKKCYMIRARELSISWGETPKYWAWISLPESRFDEVACLRHVWWLYVSGKIETRILSPETNYAAYLVYKFKKNRYGFRERQVELGVNCEAIQDKQNRNVLLDPPEGRAQRPHIREDGWMEIEMGQFFNQHGDIGTVECSLKEVVEYKRGLIIEGIELRPKDD